MARAGTLHHCVAFDAPTQTPDGSGGTDDGWTTAEAGSHICWASFRFLRGGETVMAARLSGKQPVVVGIRRSTDADAITPAWRMRDLRTGAVYNVRAAVPTDDRAMIELLCEAGVAI